MGQHCCDGVNIMSSVNIFSNFLLFTSFFLVFSRISLFPETHPILISETFSKLLERSSVEILDSLC